MYKVFKLLKILPLSLYLFLDNSDLYSIKTRNSYNIHLPSTHLTKYQNGVHYAGIRVFNHFPTSIKKTANETTVFKKKKP
jgi:hypothetical protein